MEKISEEYRKSVSSLRIQLKEYLAFREKWEIPDLDEAIEHIEGCLLFYKKYLDRVAKKDFSNKEYYGD